MTLLTNILITLTAIECFYIMYIETIATHSKTTSRIFNIPEQTLKQNTVSTLLKNQGVYNGLIGVGLFYGLLTKHSEFLYFFLAYIIIVATYGAITSNKAILFKQGLLPILAIICLYATQHSS